ncbi:MAG: hypothetical protein QXZ12_05595 [Thermoplasmata archaeon]
MIISELKDQINAPKITNYLGISRSSNYYKKWGKYYKIQDKQRAGIGDH